MKRIKNTLSTGKIIKVKRDTSVFSLFLSLKLLRSSKKDEFSSSLFSTASCFMFSIILYTIFNLFLSPVLRLTKALPQPSMFRTCSPTVTIVSEYVLSGSARTPRSWAVPTAPRWPSPPSGMMRCWPAARSAQDPGSAQSPPEPDRAWATSSALSSSSWFLPSSPSSSLLSSNILSLNEQSAPPSFRVIALLFPAPLSLCCFVFFILYLLFSSFNGVIALAELGRSRRMGGWVGAKWKL